MNEKIKNLILSLLFYGGCIIATSLIHKEFPGGMGGPGLGFVLLIFVVPIIAMVRFAVNLNLVRKGKREHLYSLIAHGVVFGAIASIILYNVIRVS